MRSELRSTCRVDALAVDPHAVAAVQIFDDVMRRSPRRCARGCAKRGCRAAPDCYPPAGPAGTAAARSRRGCGCPEGLMTPTQRSAGGMAAQPGRSSTAPGRALGASRERGSGAPLSSSLARSTWQWEQYPPTSVRASTISKPNCVSICSRIFCSRLAEKFFDFAAAQADHVRVFLLEAGLVVMLVARRGASGPARPPGRLP